MRPQRLSTKIFLLAFLNLVLLAGVFMAFARLQFGARPDMLFYAPAEERVVTLAQRVELDLQETPVEMRDALMKRLSTDFKADFYLFEMPDLNQVAGEKVTLPDKVRDEIRRPPPGRDRPGPPPPRRAEGKKEEDGPPPRREPPPPERADDDPRDPPPAGEFGRPRLLQVESAAPALYWVGARIPLHAAGEDTATPGVLLISAKSFVGTPLLFDYRPWLLLTLAVLLVFVLCWLPFIRGLTQAVTEMSHATERIAEGEFDHHLPDARRDEVGHLAAAINRMAARLAGFVTGQKRFLGDIAHELCAPIARLQFALGILERKTEPGAVDDLHQEVREMSTLVNELLSFSKSGMQRPERQLTAIDVSEVARQAVARETGGETGRVELNLEPGLLARADADALLRAISNLVRNAIRYAGDAGPIVVTARLERDEAVVTVADCGPGLPEHELDRVFEPFYRLEHSRNRASGGVGLGLSIVRNSVEACKGRVRCRNRTPAGLEAEIRLSTDSAGTV